MGPEDDLTEYDPNSVREDEAERIDVGEYADPDDFPEGIDA